MPATETRDRRSGTERLVTFTDAVAAIGLTLLALPLVDTVTSHRSESLAELFDSEHLLEFGAFLLSFLVIFRFWWAHHRVFEHVSLLSRPIVSLSILWCFGIVFLPVPTAVITAFAPSAGTVALYESTLILLSGSLLLIGIHVRRHPELSVGRDPMPVRLIGNSASTVAVMAVALLIGVLFPVVVNYWALILLFLSGTVETVFARVRARSVARRARPADPVEP